MLKLLMQFFGNGILSSGSILKQVPQFLNNFIACTGFQQTMRFKGRMLLLPTASESKKSEEKLSYGKTELNRINQVLCQTNGCVSVE